MMAEGPRPKHWRATLFGLIFIGVLLPGLLNGFYNPALAQRPLSYWLADLSTAFIRGVLIWYAIRVGIVTSGQLGFHKSVGAQRRLWLFLVLLVVTPIALLITYAGATELARLFFPDSERLTSFTYSQVLPPRGRGWWQVSILYLAVTAGFIEEVYFRAMMRHLFPTSRIGSFAYIASSALLFASVHWEGGVADLFSTACFGVVTALIFLITRNIWPLALGHTIVDIAWIR